MNTVTTTNQKYFGFSDVEVEVVKNSIAKGTSDAELRYFLGVCKSTGLNPLMKEIWCYKDAKGNLLIFAGRDGFLSAAQKNQNFAGIRSADVCENDDLVLDMMNPANNKHVINAKSRGKLVGAYAIVFRKDGEPTISYAEFAAYDRSYNAWKTHPAAMIKKVAETNALKLAFGMSGVQSEHEFEVNENTGTVIPINHQIPNEDLQAIKEGLELINDELGLAKYYKGLPIELQQQSEIIELFRNKKESL